MTGYTIFGTFDDSDAVLDECNFDAGTERYHIRTKDQVDETLEYCSGTDEAVNWNYIVWYYRGDLSRSAIKDSVVGKCPRRLRPSQLCVVALLEINDTMR